jgi:sigma-E factor negative regulatory protein RseC
LPEKGAVKVVKEEEGIIIETFDNNIVKVKVGRHNECKNCGACPGDSSVVIEAKNLLGAKTGQRIAFRMKETNMLMAAFVVYIVPLIAVSLGVFVGQVIAKKFGFSVKGFQIGGGILTFVLSIINIKMFDKFAHNNDKMQPVITQILS